MSSNVRSPTFDVSHYGNADLTSDTKLAKKLEVCDPAYFPKIYIIHAVYENIKFFVRALEYERGEACQYFLLIDSEHQLYIFIQGTNNVFTLQFILILNLTGDFS